MAFKVLAWDPIDPTGGSLRWLVENGVELDLAYPAREAPLRSCSEDAFIERACDKDAILLGGSYPITRRIMEACPNLKVIVKYGFDLSNLDLKAATSRGIMVTRTPVHADTDAVCEHTIALLLALTKRLNFYTREYMRTGRWQNPEVWATSWRGKTLGIIGFGRIGRGVARRLQGWGLTMLAYDPYVNEGEPDVEWVSLDELLTRSDFVTVHAALSSETEKMLGREQFAKMKRNAILINTARGKIIDEQALYEALRDGLIAGAGLDVFSQEPMPQDHPLLTLPNVMATPHTAAWTEETLTEMGWVGARELWRALHGQRPEHLVNPDVLSIPE